VTPVGCMSHAPTHGLGFRRGCRLTETKSKLRLGILDAKLPSMMTTVEDPETLEAFKAIEQLGEEPAPTRSEAVKTVEYFFSVLHLGVPKTTAARFLAVTDETVNAWLRRGVLKSVRIPGSPKVFVDLQNLVQTAIQIRDLRERGQHRNLAVHLLNRVDGQGFEGRPAVARAIQDGMEQVRQGVRGIVLDEAWFDRHRPE